MFMHLTSKNTDFPDERLISMSRETDGGNHTDPITAGKVKPATVGPNRVCLFKIRSCRKNQEGGELYVN